MSRRTILILLTVGAAAAAVSSLAMAATRYGNGGDNTLRGGKGNDELVGRGGNDRLFGRGGSDSLAGGQGRDLLRGGQGRDVADYRGEDGATRVNLRQARSESDRLGRIEGVYSDEGADVLLGNRGNGTFDGGDGRDRIDARRGSDTIFAWSGRDRVKGGPGDDDIFSAGDSRTVVRCGGGRDHVSADRKDRLRDCEQKSF